MRAVALLRGVNVGGRHRLPAPVLQATLEELGCMAVATFLHSGNAVFSHPAADLAGLDAHLAATLQARCGFPVPCLLRTAEQWRAAVAANPLAAEHADGSRLLAIFLSGPPPVGRGSAHDPLHLDPANIRVGEGVLYQWCPGGVQGAPAVVPYVERYWGVQASARNWNTVTRLAALLES